MIIFSNEEKQRLMDHLEDIGNPHLVEFPILSGSAVLDFGMILSAGVAELTLTVNGAVVGQPVALSSPSSIEAGLIWCGFVSATDTVTVRLYNSTTMTVNLASGTWKAVVITV